MFAGAYWSHRPETRREAAVRLATFLDSIAGIGEPLAVWYPKQRRKPKGPLQPAKVDVEALQAGLRSNRRDVGGTVIEELGYSIAFWNGGDLSLSAGIGGWAPEVGNAVVLSDGSGPAVLDDAAWERVLEEMIRAFEPESATVVSSAALKASPGGDVIDLGWLSWRRSDGAITRHPERR